MFFYLRTFFIIQLSKTKQYFGQVTKSCEKKFQQKNVTAAQKKTIKTNFPIFFGQTFSGKSLNEKFRQKFRRCRKLFGLRNDFCLGSTETAACGDNVVVLSW